MARLAVLKKRHEEQMLLAGEEEHGAGHPGEEATEQHDLHHHPDSRVHKLPVEQGGEAGGHEAEERGWREVTAPPGKWGLMTLEEVRAAQARFSVARNWTQFHKPRNILAALTAEVGELTEGLGLWREVGFGGEGLTASGAPGGGATQPGGVR